MTGIFWPLHVFGGLLWVALTAALFLFPDTFPVKARKALTGISHLFMLLVLGSGLHVLVGRGGIGLGAGARETVLLIKVVAALGLVGVIFAGARARRAGDADRTRLLSTVGLALAGIIVFCAFYLAS